MGVKHPPAAGAKAGAVAGRKRCVWKKAAREEAEAGTPAGEESGSRPEAKAAEHAAAPQILVCAAECAIGPDHYRLGDTLVLSAGAAVPEHFRKQ